MHFECISTVKYPLPIVWETMRDYLPELASQQDDIDYIKVEKRAPKGAISVHVISEWKADPPLPSLIKGFIKPDMLVWIDDADWRNEEHICHFTITPHYQIEEIHCVGSIKFEPEAKGKSTKIIYSGKLTIARTSRSSIFMTGIIIKGIEAVAGKLIEHNFSKVVKTLDEMIRSQKFTTA
jgi:hypothetical protein